jgi:hypothetical protein
LLWFSPRFTRMISGRFHHMNSCEHGWYMRLSHLTLRYIQDITIRGSTGDQYASEDHPKLTILIPSPSYQTPARNHGSIGDLFSYLWGDGIRCYHVMSSWCRILSDMFPQAKTGCNNISCSSGKRWDTRTRNQNQQVVSDPGCSMVYLRFFVHRW